MGQPFITVVTGSLASRARLDRTLDGVVQWRTNVLIVDAALFAHVRRSVGQRYILIGSTGTEIGQLISYLNGLENGRDELIIAGRTSDRHERALIRMHALRAGSCGVLIAKDEDNDVDMRVDGKAESALQKLQKVLQIWSRDGHGTVGSDGVDGIDWSDGTLLNDVWVGESQWENHEDVIIPPGWDSETKIRAVVEASGASFGQIEREIATSMKTSTNQQGHADQPPVFPPHLKTKSANEQSASNLHIKNVEGNMPPEQDGAVLQAAKSWFMNYGNWKRRMEMDRASTVDTAAAAEPTSQHANRNSVQGDYFQRLLAHAKR